MEIDVFVKTSLKLNFGRFAKERREIDASNISCSEAFNKFQIWKLKIKTIKIMYCLDFLKSFPNSGITIKQINVYFLTIDNSNRIFTSKRIQIN